MRAMLLHWPSHRQGWNCIYAPVWLFLQGLCCPGCYPSTAHSITVKKWEQDGNPCRSTVTVITIEYKGCPGFLFANLQLTTFVNAHNSSVIIHRYRQVASTHNKLFNFNNSRHLTVSEVIMSKDKQNTIFHVLKGVLGKLPCEWASSLEMRGLNLAILTSTSRELQH